MKHIQEQPIKPISIKHKHKKSKKPLILLTIGIVSVLLLITSWIIFDATVRFFRVYTIVKHQPITIKIQAPLEIISIEALEQRTQQERNIEELTKRAIEQYLNPEIATQSAVFVEKILASTFFDIIWKNESTRGAVSNDPTALHMYCRARGMWNEIGYNPQNKFCFQDREEAELYVAYYIKKNCNGQTMAQCLCRWNTGTNSPTCAYAENKLSLAN